MTDHEHLRALHGIVKAMLEVQQKQQAAIDTLAKNHFGLVSVLAGKAAEAEAPPAADSEELRKMAAGLAELERMFRADAGEGTN